MICLFLIISCCIALSYGHRFIGPEGWNIVDYDEHYYYLSIQAKMAESLSVSNCSIDGAVGKHFHKYLPERGEAADLTVKLIPPSEKTFTEWRKLQMSLMESPKHHASGEYVCVCVYICMCVYICVWVYVCMIGRGAINTTSQMGHVTITLTITYFSTIHYTSPPTHTHTHTPARQFIKVTQGLCDTKQFKFYAEGHFRRSKGCIKMMQVSIYVYICIYMYVCVRMCICM